MKNDKSSHPWMINKVNHIQYQRLLKRFGPSKKSYRNSYYRKLYLAENPTIDKFNRSVSSRDCFKIDSFFDSVVSIENNNLQKELTELGVINDIVKDKEDNTFEEYDSSDHNDPLKEFDSYVY